MKSLKTKLFSIVFCCLIFSPSKSQKVHDDKRLHIADKPKGFEFKVDSVVMADSLLLEDEARKVFENKVGKEILFFPLQHQNLRLVDPDGNNAFLQTVHECYDNHRPLILTPDVIWLAICQGVSIHINQNYESLKNEIFLDNKPEKILVRNDSLEFGGRHWQALIDSFAQQTRRYTKDNFYTFFASGYSTTGMVERSVYQITTLESYKSAFQYIGESGCGIPSITIAGKKSDWEMILRKLDLLRQVGLEDWANELRPVIKEFIKASEGKPDAKFWKSIYKDMWEYGAHYISGWVIKFFPYIKEMEPAGEYDEEKGVPLKEVFKRNQYLAGDDFLASTLSTDNFPSGVANVPVIWNNYFKQTTQTMQVFGGFMAIKQYPDKSLQPHISWAICIEDAKPVEHYLSNNSSRGTSKHDLPNWSPFFNNKEIVPAIYDVKQFKTAQGSKDFIRTLILDSLHAYGKFNRNEYAGDTLSIQVFLNGKVGKVNLINSKNELLNKYVEGIIKSLPAVWLPAMARPEDVFDIAFDFNKKDKAYINAKVRVNSLVKILL